MKKIASSAACLLVALSCSTWAIAKEAPKADNTAQNEGATRNDAVTPQKQGNSKSDVTVLAEVRKSVMAQKELSMDAKNVKILYSKGLVTLRGPVDSDEEKAKVEELAKACSGVTAVKNMITVAPKAH
jgi:hyperosmotically inducible periplasmic protein